jgi:mono/diheme cytochrome c family protein
MNRNLLIASMFLATAGFAAAQIQAPTSDVLGAHLNYGRGCAACHAPHSGAFGNGYVPKATTVTTGVNAGLAINDVPNTGTVALWGQDVSNLLGQTIVTGGGGYTEVLPTSITAGTPDVLDLLTCLSCHDGNYATGAMMQNKVYETLPGTYGGSKPPTLLGDDGTGVGNYLNDHPVGLNATIGCGGSYNWDCTISATGSILMNGPNSSAFLTNYGFFVSPVAYNNKPTVMCTTCHNQHLMNVVKVTNGVTVSATAGKGTGLPTGYYATMFFIRAPYNPATTTAGSNQTAQFCRQCHGGEANESNGSYTIPTTF